MAALSKMWEAMMGPAHHQPQTDQTLQPPTKTLVALAVARMGQHLCEMIWSQPTCSHPCPAPQLTTGVAPRVTSLDCWNLPLICVPYVSSRSTNSNHADSTVATNALASTRWDFDSPAEPVVDPRAVLATQRTLVAKFYEVGCCSRRCTAHVPMEDLLRRRLLSIQMSDSCRDFFVLGQLLTSHIVDDSKSALEPHGVRARRERNVFRYSADHTICRDLFLMMNATGVKRYRTLLGRFKSREMVDVNTVVNKRKATTLTRRTKQKRGRIDLAGVPRNVKQAIESGNALEQASRAALSGALPATAAATPAVPTAAQTALQQLLRARSQAQSAMGMSGAVSRAMSSGMSGSLPGGMSSAISSGMGMPAGQSPFMMTPQHLQQVYAGSFQNGFAGALGLQTAQSQLFNPFLVKAQLMGGANFSPFLQGGVGVLPQLSAQAREAQAAAIGASTRVPATSMAATSASQAGFGGLLGAGQRRG